MTVTNSSGYVLRSSGVYVKQEYNTREDRPFRERIAELEDLHQEDVEWIALGGDSDFEFSRWFTQDIARLARIMFIKNPLIGRGVKVKADYVFGRGVNVQARDPEINTVVRNFWNDTHNRREFTAQQACIQREIDLQTDGNIFFVLVPHSSTGHIRVHSISEGEITDIITNPDDKKENWYYRREWIERSIDFSTGIAREERKIAYYQDHRYQSKEKLLSIGNVPIIEGQYIYHIKVGGFSDWKFGISEIYSPLAWAKAYRIFLQNWSTIVDAYARFAFVITTTGGKQGVAAAKSKLASTVTASSAREYNPSPVAASNIIMQEGNTIEPLRTSGATTKAEDGRRLLLMVCAAFGLPETFFGDVSVGTLATARSLDRPTELMLTNRQALWTGIYHDILDFVLRYAVLALNGPLRPFATITQNEYEEEQIAFNENIDPHIDVDFPSIIEIDTEGSIRAIISGATFDNKQPTILNDPKMLARMVLTALGENDIDEILERLYPDDTLPINDQDDPLNDPAIDVNTTALQQAAQDMRAAVEALRESLNANKSTATA